MANLITAAQVVTFAVGDKNFQAARIKDSHIQIAQARWIRPALGDDLYEYLIALTTPAGKNKTLIETYLQPAIAFLILHIILPEVSMQFTTTGVQIPSIQGNQPATDKQRAESRTQYLENGETLLRDALRWIEDDDQINDFDLYARTISVRRNTGGVIFY